MYILSESFAFFFRRSLFSLSGPLLFHCCSQGALLWDNQQPWSCLSPCALPPVCCLGNAGGKKSQVCLIFPQHFLLAGEDSVESNLQSWQQPRLFGVLMGTLCPTTQLDVTQSWQCKLRLVTRDGHFRLCLPCYLAITFIYVYIQEVSTLLGFCNSSQMVLNFNCHSLYSFPHPPLPTICSSDPPVQSPPHPFLSINSISLSQ